MISLEKFISKYTGSRAGVPWGYTGQCVSLVQRYLNECLGFDMHPRGNAKDWVNTLINEGIAQKVNGTPQRGDIIVYGSSYGGGYGHVGIAVGNGNIFDQNNSSHNSGAAGQMRLFGTYTIMRPYKKPIYDQPVYNKADQILYPGSKVRFNGIFRVDAIDVKNNLFGSNALTGARTKSYHWIPSGPFTEVNSQGDSSSQDQILYVGDLVKNDTIYNVEAISIRTNSAKLNINGRMVWIFSKYLYEVSNN